MPTVNSGKDREPTPRKHYHESPSKDPVPKPGANPGSPPPVKHERPPNDGYKVR
jgi:hypothetical protein